MLNRTTATTDDKLLATPYRRSICTSDLPHSVNADVVISIYSRRVMPISYRQAELNLLGNTF